MAFKILTKLLKKRVFVFSILVICIVLGILFLAGAGDSDVKASSIKPVQNSNWFDIGGWAEYIMAKIKELGINDYESGIESNTESGITDLDTRTSLAKKDTSGTFQAKENEIELIEERTKSFKKFQLPDAADGRKRYRIGGQIGPVHYKTDPFSEQELYKEIDLTVLPTPNQEWDYAMETNGYQVRFWNKLEQQQDSILYVAEFRRAGKWLKLAPLALIWENDLGEKQLIAEPQESDEPIINNQEYHITWKDVFGKGIDFRYNLSPDKFFKTVVISSKDDLPEPTINKQGLKLTVVLGMSWDETTKLGQGFAKGININELPAKYNSALVFDETLNNPDEFNYQDEQNRDVWWLHQPKAWDSSEERKTMFMDWTLNRNQDNVFCEVFIPEQELNNPGLVYPLYVDTAIPEEQVGASTDDGREKSNHFMDLDDSSVYLAHTGLNEAACGFRWTTVPIPGGVTIDSSTVSWDIYSIAYDDPNTNIYFQEGDAATLSTANNDITSRDWTENSVFWSDTAIGAGYVASPDLSVPLQEVINGSWNEDDDLMCITQAAGLESYHRVKNYDYYSSGAKFNCSYTEASSNTLPVASSVSIDSAAASVALTEATTKNVVCTATVTDDDGYEDITSVEAKLYRTGVGAGAGDDNSNHYTLTGDANCVPSGGSGTTETYTCTFPVQFYADPTDAGSTYEADNWTCQVTPSDDVGAGTAATDTIEMDSLTALNVTATITYGALALNANTGTADQTTVVTNTGNRQIDAQVDGYGASDGDGYAMTCTIGTFALSYERYSIAASTDWATKTQLTDTAATITAFDLAKGASSTKNIYWGLGLPSTGVGGSCSGKVNFTATNG